MALEANVCAVYCLQDKQKLQVEGNALNMNANKKDFKWDSYCLDNSFLCTP